MRFQGIKILMKICNKVQEEGIVSKYWIIMHNTSVTTTLHNLKLEKVPINKK